VFDDLHLVAEDGRAIAVFTAGAEMRAALADALSWQITRQFQSGALDEAEAVLEMRVAGALADRLDQHRGVEGRAPVRLNADHVRLLIGAAAAYVSERDVESYQPPEERERIGQLSGLVDPLFDLVADLDRADEVLRAGTL
jgi:S-methylmethionine-dependent homocysteine/selenocysteine methylase